MRPAPRYPDWPTQVPTTSDVRATGFADVLEAADLADAEDMLDDWSRGGGERARAGRAEVCAGDCGSDWKPAENGDDKISTRTPRVPLETIRASAGLPAGHTGVCSRYPVLSSTVGAFGGDPDALWRGGLE